MRIPAGWSRWCVACAGTTIELPQNRQGATAFFRPPGVGDALLPVDVVRVEPPAASWEFLRSLANSCGAAGGADPGGSVLARHVAVLGDRDHERDGLLEDHADRVHIGEQRIQMIELDAHRRDLD